MKSTLIIGVIALLSLQSCGGGDDCYRCRKNSYFNGINYTDPGPWTKIYKGDGESNADFEQRIHEKKDNGFTCEPL